MPIYALSNPGRPREQGRIQRCREPTFFLMTLATRSYRANQPRRRCAPGAFAMERVACDECRNRTAETDQWSRMLLLAGYRTEETDSEVPAGTYDDRPGYELVKGEGDVNAPAWPA